MSGTETPGAATEGGASTQLPENTLRHLSFHGLTARPIGGGAFVIEGHKRRAMLGAVWQGSTIDAGTVFLPFDAAPLKPRGVP